MTDQLQQPMSMLKEAVQVVPYGRGSMVVLDGVRECVPVVRRLAPLLSGQATELPSGVVEHPEYKGSIHTKREQDKNPRG